MKNLDKGTVIRTVLLFIALFNQVLVAFGHAPVAVFNEQQVDDVYTAISTVVTAALSIWAWFKNNYITKKGYAQKQALQQHGLVKGGK